MQSALKKASRLIGDQKPAFGLNHMTSATSESCKSSRQHRDSQFTANTSEKQCKTVRYTANGRKANG